MKTIVRIEHENGCGFWRAKDAEGNYITECLSFYDELVEKHSNFPTPFEEQDLACRIYDTEFCAFNRVEDLQKWIEPEWFKELKTLGFKVLLLDVSECREGVFQTLFKKENILQTKDISNLF